MGFTRVLPARLFAATFLFLVSACVFNKADEAPKAENDGDDGAGVTDDATDAGSVMEQEGAVDNAVVAPASGAAAGSGPGMAAKAFVGPAAAPAAAAAPLGKGPAPVLTAPAAAQQQAAKSVSHPVQKALAHRPSGGKAARTGKVVRYVSVDVLNVRSSPRSNAAVIGKLTRGSMFTVAVRGGWAKLGEGEYVQTKYLSRSRPKLHASLATRK